MDAYSRPGANVLVVRTLICVLKSSPATDIIHQDRLKIGGTRLHLQHKGLQPIPTVHSETAASGILEDTHNCVAALLGISTDLLELIFGRIFLKICRHPHVGSG